MWPTSVSDLRARVSALNRTRQVLQALARHGLGSVVDQLGLWDASLADPQPDTRTAARFGRRLALALTDLGPTFVKLGQLLATRDDLLPPGVTTELAGLQDQVRALPEGVVREQIARDLGGPVEQWFALFGPDPLAAASIAQVHRALTRSGANVVVKVRRPGIEATIEDDLALLAGLAELIEARVEEARPFDPRGIARTFAEGLRRELDFREEAAAFRRMRAAVGGTAHVPAVFDALSGRAVLTLAYVDGPKVTDVQDPATRRALARALLRTFLHQVLRGGCFHADPHPGNLLAIGGGPRLALVDLGAVGTVDAPTRAVLLRLAATAATRDAAGFGAALRALAEVGQPADPDAWDRDVRALLDGLAGATRRTAPVSAVIERLFALVRTHGLRIRGEVFTLLRATALVDGVLRELDPELDPVRAAVPQLLDAAVRDGALPLAYPLARKVVARAWATEPAVRWGVALVVTGVAASALAAALALALR